MTKMVSNIPNLFTDKTWRIHTYTYPSTQGTHERNKQTDTSKKKKNMISKKKNLANHALPHNSFVYQTHTTQSFPPSLFAGRPLSQHNINNINLSHWLTDWLTDLHVKVTYMSRWLTHISRWGTWHKNKTEEDIKSIKKKRNHIKERKDDMI